MNVLTGALRESRVASLLDGVRTALTDLMEDPPDINAAISAYRNEFLAAGHDPLNPRLPIAFALVRESSARILGLRHFDVQIMGGVVLHEGKISEMKTGEGKTLVATLPTFLNALGGRGVHIVTVNDFLAKRDRQWMGKIYEFLGLTVGLIQNETATVERRRSYAADVTFGTNNEFGFDYLRDNMAQHAEDAAQRGFAYAIVDEVDSILIDEARTPLIISGPAEESLQVYRQMDDVAVKLQAGEDFEVDEKHHAVSINEKGIDRASTLLRDRGLIPAGSLYEPQNIHLAHYLLQALRARQLYKLDVDYVVKDGKILIVDEFTGRLMPGRRWSEGLHQAVEAKERVRIEEENQTLATITLQNYFRMYAKLAGMTGTADTEAVEFKKIYNLDVTVVLTAKPMVRRDLDDMIYRTKKEKYNAIIEEIARIHETGAPILVGTISIEVSELLSTLLKRKGIAHNVLNAKYHEREAYIIAEAGKKDALTIATNMAGRGTDIVLGDDVPDLGGLHIIGTERHEARRIDNQLRGRAGRQGDPGQSQFFVSLEDDLMRLFGSERISGWLTKLGLQEGEPIFHPWITKNLAKAQGKVEAMNFEARKHLLEFDDVMNRQREIIYRERNIALRQGDLRAYVVDLMEDRLESAVLALTSEKDPPEEWDREGLTLKLRDLFGLDLTGGQVDGPTQEALYDRLRAALVAHYEERESDCGPERLRQMERFVVLWILDKYWKEHLYALDNLREGIGLRGYGQKDPLVEYKRESFDMFEQMLDGMKNEMVQLLFRISRVRAEDGGAAPAGFRGAPAPGALPTRKLTYGRSFVSPAAGPSGPSARFGAAPAPPPKLAPRTIDAADRVGRNDPCPCGSGKKYKHCCMNKAA
ncbi:MAG: preprotein translocase subunit SecA [Candidatus Lindowbacteria bacterium RIFCSPLOWO2_12_FULL_62_27]|nr:MAG: preprotein translocase subunit SecA [Candidatus Lindowbacteria bacterium RIFCSPLOWO2_12_FULL_62_27]OGH55793.1 MAG: preprotein translocase subunit SecA [Candidatus Lindowbacteria bacterium RIFCSPLOWO2_02_FULL_62_12]